MSADAAPTGPPAGRRHLGDKAAAYVRGLIMSGQLRPGTVVRPETVGGALGISTTPAREGLQALRVEGFLTVAPRQGFVVGDLTGQDIRDLFRAQALIAGELAAQAAGAASDDQIRELTALHHELIAAATRDDQALLEAKNHEFHRQINLMASRPKIAWVLHVLTRYVPHHFYAQIPGWSEATVTDHDHILGSIRHRETEAARTAMQDHIAHAGELLAAHFEQQSAEADSGSIAPPRPR